MCDTGRRKKKKSGDHLPLCHHLLDSLLCSLNIVWPFFYFFSPLFPQHLQERDRHMQIVFLTAERISSKVGKQFLHGNKVSTLIKTAKDGKLNFWLFCGCNQKRLKDRFNGDFNFKWQMKKIIISEPSKKNHFWTKMNQNVIRFHFFDSSRRLQKIKRGHADETWTNFFPFWHALASSCSHRHHRHFLSFLQCVTRHTRINNKIIRVFFFFFIVARIKRRNNRTNCIFSPTEFVVKIKIKNFVLIIKKEKKRICNGSLSFLTWKTQISMLRPKKGICGQLFFFLFSVVVCNSPMVHMLSQLWILFLSFVIFFYLIALEFGRGQDSVNRCNMPPPPNSHSNWKYN